MLEKMQELGDVKFIINVGDSFYPSGVKSKNDPLWDRLWRKRFHPMLRALPWHSVYGNHDIHYDPGSCGRTGAQVNKDPNSRHWFHMPHYSWFKGYPELGLEVVAMDLNYYMDAWKGWNYSNLTAEKPSDCRRTKCRKRCEEQMLSRAGESFALFYKRLQQSKAKNLVVFSHYPTDYFSWNPDFLGNLSDNSKHKIEYFGGHRHNTDDTSTTSTWPNHNWLVGGGGGWGCEKYMFPPQQGFVVGEVDLDYKLSTYPVFVDYATCCYGINYTVTV